jgi:hypothetical protein
MSDCNKCGAELDEMHRYCPACHADRDAIELAAPVGLVFEAADVSNEETYWTLGLWPTLDDALNALRVDDPTDIGCNEADDYDEHRTIEVRERRIGWCGMGRRVAKLEWKATYDEASDEYKWTRTETPNTKGQP